MRTRTLRGVGKRSLGWAQAQLCCQGRLIPELRATAPLDRQKGLCPCFLFLGWCPFPSWTEATVPPQQRLLAGQGIDTAALSPQEIIDLTCEDTNTDPTPLSSLAIIDLTEDMCSPLHSTPAAQNPRNAAPAVHTSHPQLCLTVKEEMQEAAELSPAPASHSTPVKLSSTTVTAETMESCSCLSPASRRHSWSSEQDFNSNSDSQSDSDCLSPSPPSLDSNSSWRADGSEEEPAQPSQERSLPPRLSPAPTIPGTPGKAQRSLLEASDFPPHQPVQQATPARTDADSKAWLDKLHNFSRTGVQHLFLQGMAPNRETQQVNRVWSSPCIRGWSKGSPCSPCPLTGTQGLWLLQFPSQWAPHQNWVPLCQGSFHSLPCLVHRNPGSSPVGS